MVMIVDDPDAAFARAVAAREQALRNSCEFAEQLRAGVGQFRHAQRGGNQVKRTQSRRNAEGDVGDPGERGRAQQRMRGDDDRAAHQAHQGRRYADFRQANQDFLALQSADFGT